MDRWSGGGLRVGAPQSMMMDFLQNTQMGGLAGADYGGGRDTRHGGGGGGGGYGNTDMGNQIIGQPHMLHQVHEVEGTRGEISSEVRLHKAEASPPPSFRLTANATAWMPRQESNQIQQQQQQVQHQVQHIPPPYLTPWQQQQQQQQYMFIQNPYQPHHQQQQAIPAMQHHYNQQQQLLSQPPQYPYQPMYAQQPLPYSIGLQQQQIRAKSSLFEAIEQDMWDDAALLITPEGKLLICLPFN